jgi:chromosome partitioning protein
MCYVTDMIVTTASGKGGVGKTTTAVMLANAATEAGFKTVVVNVDPQRSIVHWLGERHVRHMPHVSTAEELQAVDQPGQLTIVDTPPGTAPQALAGWEAADVLIACTGASTIDVAGVADLAERLGGNLESIDLIAVCRFDARQKLAHGVVQLLRQRWGSGKVVIFPARAEVARAYDEQRGVATSSPVAVAANDLLSRLIELPAAKGLQGAASHG